MPTFLVSCFLSFIPDQKLKDQWFADGIAQYKSGIVSEYKEAFNLYDKDKDGIIATQKLGRVLRAMGLNPTEIEIQEMIDEIDSEGRWF